MLLHPQTRCRIRKSGRHNSFDPLFCTIVLVENALGAHQHSQEPLRSNCGLFSAREFQFSCRKTIYHTRLMDPLMHVSNDRQSRLRRQSSIYFQLFICQFNTLHSLTCCTRHQLTYPFQHVSLMNFYCCAQPVILLSPDSYCAIPHTIQHSDQTVSVLTRAGSAALSRVTHQLINIRH